MVKVGICCTIIVVSRKLEFKVAKPLLRIADDCTRESHESRPLIGITLESNDVSSKLHIYLGCDLAKLFRRSPDNIDIHTLETEDLRR